MFTSYYPKYQLTQHARYTDMLASQDAAENESTILYYVYTNGDYTAVVPTEVHAEKYLADNVAVYEANLSTHTSKRIF